MADTEDFLDRLGELTTELLMVDDPDAGELDRVASGLDDMRQQFGVLRTLEDNSARVDEVLESVDAAEEDLATLRGDPDRFEDHLQELTEELTHLEGLIRSYSETVESGSEEDPPSPSEPSGDTDSPTDEEAPDPASYLTDPGDYDEELFYDFFTEANEHLVEFEDVLLTLEESRDTDALNRGFRGMHSIKGAAGFLNLGLVNKLSHAMEDLLGLYRDEGYPIEEEQVELLFESMDGLKKLINLHHVTVDQTEPQEIDPGYYEDLQSRLRATIEATGESADRVEPTAQTTGETPASPRDDGGLEQVETQSIRVNTGKIDTLVNRAGEMVTTFHQLDQMRRDNGGDSNREKRKLFNQMDRIVGDIQEEALSLRMVPLKGAFNKTRRLVRDLSKQFGKEVNLTIRGEETELDRSLVEKVQDPLVHLVRNAMDHGVEQPDLREEKGKPRTGELEIAAYHESGDVVIEISDDGAGIDAESVFEKAAERGLVEPGAQLPDPEIYQLLFEPGFSTTDEVTDVSGRGVGMDVVRRNIESIRGTIDVESTPGEGTTFRLNIPLTLSIINGMILRLGDRRFVLPTTNIVRSLNPDRNQLTTLEGRGEVINVHDELINLCRLNRLFDTGLEDRDVTETLVVVVRGSSRKVALQVDDLLGQQEVVIKSLGDAFENLRGISGAAILGDGEVGLIIDTQTLEELAAGSLGTSP